MKTVLITGGSRGIGKATVKEFLDRGYLVLATSTSGILPAEHKNLKAYKFQLEDTKTADELVSRLQKDNYKIDVLINNACKANKEEVVLDLEILKNTIDTNLIGTINLTQQILPLINDGGVIINISSEFGSLTEDWGCTVPSYRIEKTAINMFTRNFYDCKEVKSRNIKVYSFDPGWVKTDMGGSDAEREPEEPAKELLQLAESGNESGLFYRGNNVRDW